MIESRSCSSNRSRPLEKKNCFCYLHIILKNTIVVVDDEKNMILIKIYSLLLLCRWDMDNIYIYIYIYIYNLSFIAVPENLHCLQFNL